jgi:hypothetical protein
MTPNPTPSGNNNAQTTSTTTTRYPFHSNNNSEGADDKARLEGSWLQVLKLMDEITCLLQTHGFRKPSNLFLATECHDMYCVRAPPLLKNIHKWGRDFLCWMDKMVEWVVVH